MGRVLAKFVFLLVIGLLLLPIDALADYSQEQLKIISEALESFKNNPSYSGLVKNGTIDTRQLPDDIIKDMVTSFTSAGVFKFNTEADQVFNDRYKFVNAHCESQRKYYNDFMVKAGESWDLGRVTDDLGGSIKLIFSAAITPLQVAADIFTGATSAAARNIKVVYKFVAFKKRASAKIENLIKLAEKFAKKGADLRKYHKFNESLHALESVTTDLAEFNVDYLTAEIQKQQSVIDSKEASYEQKKAAIELLFTLTADLVAKKVKICTRLVDVVSDLASQAVALKVDGKEMAKIKNELLSDLVSTVSEALPVLGPVVSICNDFKEYSDGRDEKIKSMIDAAKKMSDECDKSVNVLIRDRNVTKLNNIFNDAALQQSLSNKTSIPKTTTDTSTSTKAPDSEVIKNNKKNIQTSVALTKPTISPATIEAGKTVTITTTTDKEIPSSKAVFLVVNNNEAQPIKMTPLSATKWSHNLVVSKAGNHQVKAYLSSLSGIISSENSASSTAEFKVTPTAKVTKVVPDKADVVDGGSMKFTATVSGAVDEANGDQVLLWLDSYKQPMQRVGNSQTWSTTVTNIAGVNGKRDYTARVQNDDAFSAEAPHGTLTVKLSDAILIAEAHEISAQSRRVDTVKLNDHVHFFVETGGTVNGAVRIKLNQWSTPPLIKLSENKWRTAESIPIQQAEDKTYYAYVEVKGQEAVKSATKPLKVVADTGLVCPLSANTGDLLDAELLIDRSKVTVTSGKLYIDTCGEDSGEREIGFSESGGGWKWPGITIKEKYCGTFKVIVKASDNKTYNCTTYVNSKVSGVQVGKSLTELQPVKPPPYKDITCLGNQRGNVLPLTLSGDIMNFNCSYTDEYYADRGLEGSCCVSGIGCKTFKLKQKVQQAVQLMPGKNICDVYYDDGQVNHEEHDHLEIVVQDNRPEIVKKLYSSFADYYNSKDDSRLRSLISDDWESVGDGTTLADLEMNLRSSFRIFDQVSYTIQNLQIASMGSGKFKATYDVVIKGQIYKNRINHEEKSSVSEEVTVDTNGKAKISKTLNGRFWYVQ